MTISLADVNQTLLKQTAAINEEQIATQTRIDVLSNSFNDFFTMVKGDAGDELEAEREQRDNVERRVRDDAQRDGKPGRFFDFDLGNFLPFATAAIGGLLKRGIPAALGVMLADEIGEAVTKFTGSQVLGNVSEWATMGGAFGFLFGGVKGGLLGATIGAIFSEASRDKIAEVLSDTFDKEITAESTETLIAASAASGIALLAPAIIAKIMPLLLSPAGLLMLAAGASVTAALKYFTDDKFRANADKHLDPIRNKVDELMAGIGSEVRDYLNKVFPDFITTDKEIRNIDELLGPERLAQQRKAEAELDQANKLQDKLRVEAQAQPFSDTTRFERINTFAKEQGINLSDYTGADGRKLSEYTGGAFSQDASMLSMEVSKILATRSLAARELLEEIQRERALLEQRLNAGEVLVPPKNSGYHAHPALRKMSTNTQLNDAITTDQKKETGGNSIIDMSSPTVVNNAGDSTFVSNSTPDVIDSRAVLL